jgi:glycosyltransferase involved in cell wall biosynthesis
MMKISVIIPTTCEERRATSLRRAIDSVLSQHGVEVELIVVVNGQRFQPERLEALRSDPALRAVYIETPSPSVACRHGRSIATGEFFAFLDDDDEYLPGALAARLAPLASDPTIDLVVTNGYCAPGDSVQIARTANIESDPFGAMLEQNWLASCGSLFRRSSCGDELFADLTPYMEWTLLAYRLLLAGKRMKFVDIPTYRINDTPQSASKSREYRLAAAVVIETVLSLPLPPHNRRRLRARLLAARHDLSVMSLEEGRRGTAWALHLQSLAGLSGLRYLSYTRRLFFTKPVP